jgi:excisionase family DNA binding protein
MRGKERARPDAQRATEIQRRAFTIHEFAARNGIGKDKAYSEVREGRLRARKLGKRTLILDTDEQAWRDSLPLLEFPAA